MPCSERTRGSAAPAAQAALLVAAIAAIGHAPSARAELIEIAWSPQQRYERSVEIAPGKFAEVCGKLSAGSAVTWQFDAAAPLDFNIHYHQGKEVVFPEKSDGTPKAAGRMQVSVDHGYCWMWTNPGKQPVALRLQLAR